jgi:hypothetical protein
VARIWVLRESKLPLKMHCTTRAATSSCSSRSITPTAAGCVLRRCRVCRGAKQVHRTTRTAITALVRARRRHEATRGGPDPCGRGRYKAPQVKRVASNDDGDVLLVTTASRTSRPPALIRTRRISIPAHHRHVGNEYLIAYQTWGNSERGEHRWVLMPQPPMKRGDGPRRITMDLRRRAPLRRAKGTKDGTLDIPAPATHSAAKEWPATWSGRSDPRGGSTCSSMAR